ncbi:hypothetical protein [Bradyrhizobium sp.]|uniref:hypothetical protein n=1 Tax=Bradyrhizobium sp. TaxID=376 RepID=UPI0040382D0E
MRYRTARRPSRLGTIMVNRRNALAAALREALFRPRVKESRRGYRRHPKHRQSALAELMLC